MSLGIHRRTRAARPRAPGASWLLLVGLAWGLAGGPPSPASARGLGEVVKAARMMANWRYEEARELIAQLDSQAPGDLEVRYLKAELAFLDGHYARAIQLLEGIPDGLAGGSVGHLRALAASTLSVTRSLVPRPSPGGHFVIFYEPGKDEVIVDLAAEVLDKAYEVLGQDFGYYPTEPVRVELLSRPADLASLSPLTETEIETTGTIALCKYNKLMVVSPRATIFGYPWMDTLVHEYVHYVVSRVSHDNVPVWLHEGLARFQQTRWRQGPDSTLSAMEEHLLATALKNRTLITFEEMHPSMAKLPSQEAAALAFVEVFTMVAYLHGLGGYDGLRRMLELIRAGKSARRAVAETLERPWTKVEQDWRNHLRARNLEQSRSLASRATSRRIRFDKRRGDGEQHGENVGIDEVASAKARKHARLGGMLRARGMSESAAVQYEKALAITGADDPFVAAKLSRTYLEIGKYERALELAAPLHAADSNDAAPAITMGLAHMATDDVSGARQAFEAALRINPFDPAVRCNLAELYRQSAQSALAAREAAACIRLRP